MKIKDRSQAISDRPAPLDSHSALNHRGSLWTLWEVACPLNRKYRRAVGCGRSAVALHPSSTTWAPTLLILSNSSWQRGLTSTSRTKTPKIGDRERRRIHRREEVAGRTAPMNLTRSFPGELERRVVRRRRTPLASWSYCRGDLGRSSCVKNGIGPRSLIPSEFSCASLPKELRSFNTSTRRK